MLDRSEDSGSVQFDREKFLEAVHYVCTHCNPRELGRVKLHRILYFADMLHYVGYGRPLTGEEYQKQKFGPVAKHLTWALRTLSEQGHIEIGTRDYFGFPKLEVHAAPLAKPERLDDRDRHVLDEVADFVCGHTAREISDLSHNAAWQVAEMGETIPYFTAIGLFPAEVTDDDVAWGVDEAQRLRPQLSPE
jgi:uncharacterized phage-associated protein